MNAEYNLSNDPNLPRRYGYKFLAVDGSVISLPNLVLYQDFWISMLLANVASVAKAEADEKVSIKCDGKANQYQYQTNVNNAIASLCNRLPTLFSPPPLPYAQPALTRLSAKLPQAQFLKDRAEISPGKKRER